MSLNTFKSNKHKIRFQCVAKQGRGWYWWVRLNLVYPVYQTNKTSDEYDAEYWRIKDDSYYFYLNNQWIYSHGVS